MVLWEITLATAYFLGLKRTYRLALKIQRRLISPKHTKLRQFVHRRTRYAFDVAIKVHRNIQERDIEVGRNLGNWILRWLDRMKPSAQIRGPSSGKNPSNPSSNMNLSKQVKDTSQLKRPGSSITSGNAKSDRRLFTASTAAWSKHIPTIRMMMRPANPAGGFTQYRHLNSCAPKSVRSDLGGGKFSGVIRQDIMEWMHRM